MYATFFKRIIDFLGALFLIILLLPVYIICYILIRINMGSPVLFTQDRPGKNEKIFKIYKFRSMNSATDENGNLLPDKDRVTKLGLFLRKTSLDEIPQFFNILKGDMSFIGPRPLLPRYLPFYTTREKLRHTIRPGITGLAQVNGRNNLTWNEKLEFDTQYVERLSFFLDIKIIFTTIVKVLKRSDIKTDGQDPFLDEERQNKDIL
ncbi:MAG: sugar transferase [Verrucomicrobiaceae bacterium]|nr:sugar transferase [Verrucomicrobiaceae bacterium]